MLIEKITQQVCKRKYKDIEIDIYFLNIRVILNKTMELFMF